VICHGPGLKGLATVPPIAGRSPSYVVRQLNDIKTGARAGIATQLMKATVANLAVDDMVAIAAYLASLPRE
jgi:cytochrome c553